jgi:site-specific recombinase XerC
MMLRAKADPHAVKRILGHSHISVTERYLSLSDDLRAQHAAAIPFEKIRAHLDPVEVTRQRRLTRG